MRPCFGSSKSGKSADDMVKEFQQKQQDDDVLYARDCMEPLQSLIFIGEKKNYVTFKGNSRALRTACLIQTALQSDAGEFTF